MAKKKSTRQRKVTPKKKFSLFPVVVVGLILVIIAVGGVIAMRDGAIPEVTKEVILETNFGEIEIELFHAKAPRTVENFLTLAGEGFYEGTRFHRVKEGFMIQGGCPHSADEALKADWGTGGPGHTFDCEIHDENFNVRGTIAMANRGRNTNGSQFFINVADNAHLNAGHTVFGRVVSGMDFVDEIVAVETGPGDVPLEEVVLQRVTVP